MFARVISATLVGVDAVRIDVEVDVARGALPAYKVVGLPATSVKEGAIRISSALRHIGQKLPTKRITVNLAPADRPKNGAAFDLPIAVGVLAADQSVRLDWPHDLMVMGELGLDGSIRSVRGALAAAILARESGLRGLVLPEANAPEAAEVRGIEIFEAARLSDVLGFLAGELELERIGCRRSSRRKRRAAPDMSEVRGQPLARSAIEIAVAGGHNLLLLGPPGIGKTMLARRIPTILPPLSRAEAIETTKVYSALGLAAGSIVWERPFRAPHHTISAAALIGGGSVPRPGEISLAHNGVLFLDELPEFNRSTIESLRQPLEDRRISIGRARGTASFPAAFLLAAAANPCPCGWYGSKERSCVCSLRALERYRHRLSGPLLDRIDLQIRLDSVPLRELRGAPPGEGSETIRARVIEARARQRNRLRRHQLECNAEMTETAVSATCRLDERGERALSRIQAVRGFTARGIHRMLKVSRTIADLRGSPSIGVDDLFDAAGYRALDSEPLGGPGSVPPIVRAPAGPRPPQREPTSAPKDAL